MMRIKVKLQQIHAKKKTDRIVVTHKAFITRGPYGLGHTHHKSFRGVPTTTLIRWFWERGFTVMYFGGRGTNPAGTCDGHLHIQSVG